MTLTKLLLGLYNRMIFIRVCNVAVVHEFLTSQRGRIIRHFLCSIFLRRFGALNASILLEARIESLERLISTIGVLCALVPAVGAWEVVSAIGRVLVDLRVLFGHRVVVLVVVVLIRSVLSEGRLIIVVVVSDLLL